MIAPLLQLNMTQTQEFCKRIISKKHESTHRDETSIMHTCKFPFISPLSPIYFWLLILQHDLKLHEKTGEITTETNATATHRQRRDIEAW